MTESSTVEEVTVSQESSSLDALIDLLEHPEDKILPLLHASKTSKQQQDDKQNQLIQISRDIFSNIERLAKTFHQLGSSTAGTKTTNINSLLSGLDTLHVPEPIDMETLWGQVDLQNVSLQKVLKKSIQKLIHAPERIVLLDMGQIDSENEEAFADGDQDGSEDGSESEEVVDEETRRIRARMAQASDDMESDEEEGEDDDAGVDPESDDENQELNDGTKPDEDLYDPVAEDMKDGFFDLNEMENFADEEEDYLPDEAFRQPQDDKVPKQEKSFHQKQRDGDLLDQSDNDDEDALDAMYEGVKPVKRKKYRKQEDIDALYQLYQPERAEDDSDEEDAANMTAADFFGQPKQGLIERYKKNEAKRARDEVKGDNDSWGEYDFDGEENDGWRDKDPKWMQKDDAQSDDNDSSVENEGTKLDISKKAIGNSKTAKQGEKLRRQTEELEKEMLAEKPWQMTGETRSTSRPVNSLLEGTPEFEMASKQAPTITVEHTMSLEDVIKKRILAEEWDDVVPRELPDVGWHKKRGELPEVSQEKSKLGLGELYEREYLKKAVGYDRDADEKKTEEDKAKDEMRQLFANICSKLDGLSNYHFAPRPIADEAEVRAVTAPAVAMEEVLPLHVSDARGVAPEEVYATKRGREGILRGENEMDQAERKRLRSSKKSARRKARKEKLADEKLISRLQPGLGLNNPYEKRKMREELAEARSRGKVTTGQEDMDSKFGSSGTFFKRLQAEAQQSITEKAGGGNAMREKRSSSKSSAYKL